MSRTRVPEFNEKNVRRSFSEKTSLGISIMAKNLD